MTDTTDKTGLISLSALGVMGDKTAVCKTSPPSLSSAPPFYISNSGVGRQGRARWLDGVDVWTARGIWDASVYCKDEGGMETAVMVVGTGWGLTVELGVLPLLECESVWVGSDAL